jgi:hypothetical protein
MRLSVEPDITSLAPGDVVDLLVRVHNDGEYSCTPSLAVRGLDPEHVLVPSEVVAVAPGEVMTAVVRLRAGRDALAGDCRVGIAVSDLDGMQAPTSSVTVLRIGTRPDVSLEVDPAATSGRRGAKATTVLRNRSDRRLRVELGATGEGVAMRFRPSSVVLDPGETRRVRTRLRPTARHWFDEVRHGAVITARGAGQAVSSTATFTQRPAIPRSGLRAVASLAALAVWVAATVTVFQYINADDPVAEGTAVAGPVVPGPGVTSASLIEEPESTGVQIPVVIRGTVEGPRVPEGSTVTAERISFGDEGTTEGATKLVALAGVKLPRGAVLDRVEARTDERGRFRIASGLVEGAFYRVTVQRSGFDISSRIIATSEEDRDIELVVSLVPATGSLAGTVTADTGALVGGATVLVTDGAATFTATSGTEGDDLGRWSLEGLSTPADYQVIVSRRGFATQTSIVALDGGEARDGIDVVLPTALGSLRGRVTAVDPGSGLPSGVGAIDVTLEGEEARTTTTLTGSAALTGTYDLPGLPFGDYLLTFSAPGWRTQQAAVTISSGDVVFNTELLRSTGVVQGYVEQIALFDTGLEICRYPRLGDRDSADAIARPCGGVLVSLTNADGDVFGTATATIGSDTQGFFRIDGVPAGEYTLRAARPGYIDHVEQVVLAAGQTLSIRGSGDGASSVPLVDDPVTLQLAAAPQNCVGTLEVTLRDGRSGAVITTGAVESFSLPDASCSADQTPVVEPINAALGLFQISNVPIGTPTLSVSVAGFASRSQPITVASVDETRVTLNLVPLSQLTVELTDADGSPIADAEVIVFSDDADEGPNAVAPVTECTRTIDADGTGERTGLCVSTGADGTAVLPLALGLGTWRVATPVNVSASSAALDFVQTMLTDVAITSAEAGEPQSVKATLARLPAVEGQVFVFDSSTNSFSVAAIDVFDGAESSFPEFDAADAGIRLRRVDGSGDAVPFGGVVPRLTVGAGTYRIDRLQPGADYELLARAPGETTGFLIAQGSLGTLALDQVVTQGVDLRLLEPRPVAVVASVLEQAPLGAGAAAAPIAGARVRVTGSAGFDAFGVPLTITCPGVDCTGYTDGTAPGVVTDGGRLWFVTRSDGTVAIENVFTVGPESAPLTFEVEAAGYRTLDIDASVGSVTDATIGDASFGPTVLLPFETVAVRGLILEELTLADPSVAATATLGGVTVTATTRSGSVARSTISANDGSYDLTLPVGYEWVISATRAGYGYASSSGDITADILITASTDLSGQDLILVRTSGVVLRGDVTVDDTDVVEVRVFSDPAGSGAEQLVGKQTIDGGGEFTFAPALTSSTVHRVEFHVGADAAAAAASTTATATRWIDAGSDGVAPATVLLEQDLLSASFATVIVSLDNPAAQPASGVNVELVEAGPFPTLGPDGKASRTVTVGAVADEDVTFAGIGLRGIDRSILEDRLSVRITLPDDFEIDDVKIGTSSINAVGGAYPITDSQLDGGVTLEVRIVGLPDAPAVPTLTVVAQPESGSGDQQVNVAWSAPNTGGVDANTLTYIVSYRAVGGDFLESDPTAAGATTLSLTKLAPGTEYQVIVRSVNRVGSGPDSDVATATTAAVPLAPTIDTITTPGAGQLSVAFTAGDDGGSAITTYEYSLDGGAWTPRGSGTTGSPLVITGLANGTTYQVRIRAVNAVGSGAPSVSVSATTAAVPLAPTITGITPGDEKLNVAFTAGSDGGLPITTYEYSLDGGSWTPRGSGTTGSPLVITGLANGTTYQVRIRAVNAVGPGEASNEVPGAPPIVFQASSGPESTGTIETWTVPVTGDWTFTVAGAQGGSRSSGSVGGPGAVVTATFTLTQGTVVRILVGRQGPQGVSGSANQGGGGGSFVWTDGATTPLLVAGGGGGASSQNGLEALGFNATPVDYASAPGSDSRLFNRAAGWALDGDPVGGAPEIARRPLSSIAPGRGGSAGGSPDGNTSPGAGGFGGGGGGAGEPSTNRGAGGGGGYLGGVGQRGDSVQGGGGTSFHDANAKSASVAVGQAGNSSGNGSVIITRLP